MQTCVSFVYYIEPLFTNLYGSYGLLYINTSPYECSDEKRIMSNTAIHHASESAIYGPSFKHWKQQIYHEMKELCFKMNHPPCKIIDILGHVSQVKKLVAFITLKSKHPGLGPPYVEWITPSLRKLTLFVDSLALAIGELHSPNDKNPMQVFLGLVERHADFCRHEMFRIWEKVFATASDTDNDNIADRFHRIYGCGEEAAYFLVISALLQPKMSHKPVPVLDLLMLSDIFSAHVGAHNPQIQHILREMDNIVQTECSYYRAIAPQPILWHTLEHFGELGSECLVQFSAHVPPGMMPREDASVNHIQEISPIWKRWREYELLCATSLLLVFDSALPVRIETRTISSVEMQAIFPLRIDRVKMGFFYGDVKEMVEIIQTNDSYVRESVLANTYEIEHHRAFGLDFLRRNLAFNELCVGPLKHSHTGKLQAPTLCLQQRTRE